MAWEKIKGTFIGKSAPIEMPVAGVPMRFHKMSLLLVLRLPLVAEPILNALGELYSLHGGEKRTRRTAYADGLADGVEEVAEPPSPEFMEASSRRRSMAIKSIAEGLSSISTQRLLGELIMDSLYDEFPPKAQGNPDPVELVQSMSLEAMVDCLKGFYAANKDQLSPLVQRLKSSLLDRLPGNNADEAMQKAIDAVLKELKPKEESKPQPELAAAPNGD